MKYLFCVITVLLLLVNSLQDEIDTENEASTEPIDEDPSNTPENQNAQASSTMGSPLITPTPITTSSSEQPNLAFSAKNVHASLTEGSSNSNGESPPISKHPATSPTTVLQKTESPVKTVSVQEGLSTTDTDNKLLPNTRTPDIPVNHFKDDEPQQPRVTISYRCLKEDSKKCVISEINSTDPSEDISLPDLGAKIALHIKGGHMKSFTKELSKQLGDIEKLKLGPLQMEEFFLKPNLTEVEAIGNRLKTINLTPGDEYRLMILNLNDNQLESLDGFEVFFQLQELHLSSNALKNINLQTFNQMVNLKRLYLDRNHIVAIEASTSVKLPLLEFFSLTRNNLLGQLDVTNWDFESLTELDLSSNNLTDIVGLLDSFPSLSNILLARNSWQCMLLDDMLKQIADSYITVKDSDQECEGLSPANICCSADSDNNQVFDDTFKRLEDLEHQQKLLQQTYSDQIRKLTSTQSAKLTDAKKRLYRILGVDYSTGKNITQDTIIKDDFMAIRNDVKSIITSLDDEKEKLKKLNDDAKKSRNRLQHSVAELRRGLRREVNKVSELHAQFALLKDYVSSKRAKGITKSNP
ncbi:uncharacterized protein LOC129769821 [Toxorhynchites rutilus septentrionalis]|uniref:uncharacterized protein LOC129769821 n=1 Tax=Toxorhynchites rutilus septentrionalis TaxID=329112 RepID=UPI002479D365|nr:uncharacterized protein LOC129769821 [Toxorhynchites rutilus septentrionalis]